MNYVDFIDHSGNDDTVWRTLAEICERTKDSVIIRRYGRILHEDKDKVIMVAEERMDADIVVPRYRDYMVIQKKLIIGRGE